MSGELSHLNGGAVVSSNLWVQNPFWEIEDTTNFSNCIVTHGPECHLIEYGS